MTGLVRALVPSLLLLSMLVAAVQVPALGCDRFLLAEQDDARSRADAPDDRAAALRVGQADHHGALQYGAPDAPGDRIDWYELEVGPGAERVMVELHSYVADPAFQELVVVDVVPPGGEGPVATVPIGDGRTGVDASAGTWTFAIRFSEDLVVGERCGSGVEPGAPAPLESALLQYYVFYVGCDPVC